jgi:hypothetical protein
MGAASKISEEAVRKLMQNVKFTDVFTKAGMADLPETMKGILGTKINSGSSSQVKAGLDSMEDIIKSTNLKDTVEGKELLDQIVGKRKQIGDYEDLQTKKSTTEGLPIGEVDFQSFKSNWIKEVNDSTDQNARSVISNESQISFQDLPNEFNPSEIKVGRVNSYEFIQNDASTNFQDVLRSRSHKEVTLPNGKKILMYSSSGANEGTTGKKPGEWFWIPGFAKNGWYIKTAETVNFTKGGNKYMTDFAKYLETNVTSVVKNLPKTQNGYLATKFGDTSKINWTNITNAKNMSDYDVIIDNAMKTGNFNSVSRFGFEDYGIPNFRQYLMDIYNK